MIESHTIVRTVCPAELQAPTPPAIAAPVGATIKFNAAGQAYINGRFRREETVAGRLDAARAQCPK